MRNIKNSGIAWIGEIPEKWQVIRAKFVFTNKKEVVGKRHSDFDRLSLTMQGVLKRSKEASDGLQPEKFDNYQILRENELVFKLIDLENTNTSRVGLSPFVGLVSPAYIVLRNEQKDNRYFFYQYMSLYYRNVFNDLGGDGVRSALNPKDLLEMKVVLPSPLTQISIANFLDDKCIKIDALIANEEKVISELKEYKKAIVNQVVAKDNNWTTKPLRAFLKRTNKKNQPNLPLLSVERDKGVVDRETEGSPDNWNVIPEDLSGYKVVDIGNFVMNKMKAWQGSYGVSRHKGIVSPAYFVFELSFSNKEFFNIAIRSKKYIDIFAKYSSGIRVDQWDFDIEQIKNISFDYPSEKEQQKIVEMIKRKHIVTDKLIILKQQKVAELKEYKKSLIYEYVTGKREIV